MIFLHSAAFCLGALNPKRSPWVAATFPVFGELMQRFVLCGKVYRKLDQKVFAVAVLAGKTTSLDAKLLSRCRALGNGQHYRTFGCRNLALGAEHGLPQRHRQ